MPARPSFREAFLWWLKLGFINFGGPAGQIALMHKELVEKRGWISDERFLHALNYCMLLPGPEAQQLAIYVGWLLHRTIGGIVAGVLFVLPSLALLLALSWTYVTFGAVPLVAGAFQGLAAVVLAIVAHALVRIGKRALRTSALVAIATLAFVAIFLLGVPFPAIVLGAALAGLASQRLAPRLFAAPPAHEAGDLHEAPPEHARPSAARALRVVAVGAILFALPLALVLAFPGEGGVYRTVSLFFTKAALVTFGGAYAVLAYIGQAAVETYGWLSPQDVIAGLALAETTPGPLIMVVTFVGFLAGYRNPGTLEPTLAGILAGTLATYFTFLFSFLFILLGAPFIERLRGNRALSAALAAITAAVVGVILNLALFFGRHALVEGGAPDLFAIALAAAAFLALWRAKIDVAWVIAAGALLGVARALL